MGTMVVAMQKGVARGIFSNESGLGSAPIAAAAAMTKEPARQGLVSMTGTFIDTIVICTMTGLSIVIAGTWLNPDLEGVEITMAAFQPGIFCIHYDSGLELLWRALCGISVQPEAGRCERISLALYSGCVYRTLYDGCGCMEYCGYL